MRTLLLPLFFLAVSLAAPSASAQMSAVDDPKWVQALSAYEGRRNDEGHKLLLSLVNAHPGNLGLALTCYERILREETHVGSANRWVALASERLLALERLGAISANTETIRIAASKVIAKALQEGRHLEARERIDRLRQENPHDLFWQIQQARTYRRLDLLETRPLYQSLRDDFDPNHPDPAIREQWLAMKDELAATEDLPAPILPVPGGSPLAYMAPDDPDGRWRTVLDRSPADIPEEIDRLAGLGLAGNQIVPWQDMSGLTDPARALDLHLQSKPAASLKALRNLQEDRFQRERSPGTLSDSRRLALGRRFPWARGAQELLLEEANNALFAGRPHSALRTFHELLIHTIDPATQDSARVGYWTALKLTDGLAELRASAGSVDPGKEYPWMGRSAKSAEIRADLLEGVTPSPPPPAPNLSGLPLQVLHLPPVSPWPVETPAVHFELDLQVADQQVIASGRNIIASYDVGHTGLPRWSHLQRHAVDYDRRTGYLPGYYRPLIHEDTLITRWGLTSLPGELAAFDLPSGRPLWSADAKTLVEQRAQPARFAIPMGDPVQADGLLFYLQWNTVHDVNHNRGRTVSLVCFDPGARKARWSTAIAEAGKGNDVAGNLENANPAKAIYGNSVTVHRGAVYSNTNAGLIARSDVRDGRVDWIHSYRRTRSDPASGNLGSAPLVAGDKIICMPRDAGRVFALDQHTGRLVWDNPLVLAVEALGLFDDLLLLRGVRTVAALDVETGEARWYRHLPDDALPRSRVFGDSIYLGRSEALERWDARTGTLLETRPWDLGDERALAFTVSQDRLFVVSDRPAPGKQSETGKPLAEAPSDPGQLSLPLQRTWTIPRHDARIALPPQASGLENSVFVIADGILECLDRTPRGAVRWRRFLGSQNVKLEFAGETLLLVEPRRSPHASRRVLSLTARDGSFRWESAIPPNLDHSVHTGSQIVYHDRRGQMLALDWNTGGIVWERKLSEAPVTDLHWDGSKLHVFHASLWQGPQHLVVDPATGTTTSRQSVVVTHASSSPTHSRQIANGWHEVRFAPTSARFVRLTTLSDTGGRGWASAAELHVLGPDGARLPRDAWRVEAEHERQAAPRALPRNLIDGDPKSWWHTQWIGDIPPHPHHVILDLGARQTITGIQYLPAKIINYNGMIRDYELHVRGERDDWGEPVAQGIMVNHLRVERAEFGPGGLFFEARNYPKNDRAVFRYDFGQENAIPIEEDARLLSMHGRYALISTRDAERRNILVLRKTDDPAYRFDLSPHVDHGRHGEVAITGDRLLAGRHQLTIANLNERTFLDLPEPGQTHRDHQGSLVVIGGDRALKLVHRDNKLLAFLIDLETGAVREGTLDSQTAPFRDDRFLKPPGHPLLEFRNTLLVYDNANLSAWISAP